MTATTAPITEARATDPTPVTPHSRRRVWLGWLKHPLVLAVALLMVAPFIWMLLTSFKSLPQLLQDPLSIFPDPWIWSNYPDAWNALPAHYQAALEAACAETLTHCVAVSRQKNTHICINITSLPE